VNSEFLPHRNIGDIGCINEDETPNPKSQIAPQRSEGANSEFLPHRNIGEIGCINEDEIPNHKPRIPNSIYLSIFAPF